MGLSVRAYARHRGVSHVAVLKALRSGRIVVGVDGTIDPAVADQMWQERTTPRMPPPAASREPVPGDLGVSAGGVVIDAATYYRARAAALVVEVQTKRLALEQRRGALISKERAVLKAFSFARMLRDAWLTWPARVGPLLAAQFEVDATALTVALEGHVRDQLATLARERPEF
jgi:hypothetical protein